MTARPLTFIDVCAGMGGFSVGLSAAGMKCLAQIEKNAQCLELLQRHFPTIPKYKDLLSFPGEWSDAYADVFAIGDPCPKHSKARSNGDTKHPDLSGYALALVGRFRPWGVVRENVLAPTVAHFSAALEALGYGTVVIRMDSAPYTGQSRQRDYIVGLYQVERADVRKYFHEYTDGPGRYTTRLGTGQVIPALTTHRTRYDSRDCYIWHPEKQKLRILDGDERDAFAGFPPGWTTKFSEATRARMCGNSLSPVLAEKIGRCIVAAHNGYGE